MSFRESAGIDLGRAKTVGQVWGDALKCYRAYPGLFAALTLAVIGPYAILIWLSEGSTVLSFQGHHALAALVILLISALIVQPLISALHSMLSLSLARGESSACLACFSKALSPCR